jgi:hypothetical protein
MIAVQWKFSSMDLSLKSNSRGWISCITHITPVMWEMEIGGSQLNNTPGKINK